MSFQAHFMLQLATNQSSAQATGNIMRICTAITIRPAVAADQPRITALVRMARINPRNLDWQRFMVAEVEGEIVGIRQVRIHKNGTREVASGVVLPAYRRQGISAQLMQALLTRQQGAFYLMCDEQWWSYYGQFGFERVQPIALPTDFRRQYQVGQVITAILSLLRAHKVQIIPLHRAA